MKVKVKTLDGKSAAGAKGDIELDDTIFGLDARADVLHRVVTWQLEKRRPTARAAKERSDVNRTGAKAYRQKGTGNARHGDRRAPIFIGGGKAHGPRKRDFNPSLNKKIRALGLKMALSDKAQSDKLIVIENLELKDAKTKALKGHFDKLGLGASALVIDGDAVGENFRKASRNIIGIDVLPAIGANVYDIVRHDTLVLTKAAIEKLEGRFNG